MLLCGAEAKRLEPSIVDSGILIMCGPIKPWRHKNSWRHGFKAQKMWFAEILRCEAATTWTGLWVNLREFLRQHFPRDLQENTVFSRTLIWNRTQDSRPGNCYRSEGYKKDIFSLAFRMSATGLCCERPSTKRKQGFAWSSLIQSFEKWLSSGSCAPLF